MAKSTVSFVRQQLNIKGSSEHSGRGFIIMNSNDRYTYDELLKKTKELLPRWRKRKLVKSFKEFPVERWGGRRFAVEFVPEVFEEDYRTWQVMEDGSSRIGVVSMTP